MRTYLLRASAVGLATAALTLTGVSGAAVASTVDATQVMPQVSAAVTPPVPSRLPSGIEGLARYVPANSCDPTAKPGTTALGKLLTGTYPATTFGISRTCGTDPLPTSEHYDGRAVDWMTSVRTAAGKARAQAVLSWLFATDAAGNRYANARRLGVMYVIWNNKIWGSYRTSDGWRPYSSCASHPQHSYDTTCHRDHIHVSLSWEGAMKRTSFWSNKVAAVDYGPCRASDLNWAKPYTTARTTPCPSYARVSAPIGASSLLRTLTTYSGMHVATGSTGPVVRAVQQAVGAEVDGSFGPATRASVVSWQTGHGLSGTGVVNPTTWRSLLAANAPQSATKAKPTNSLTKYKHTVLRVGSRGAAVVALQKSLHITADGWFGPQTRTRVNTFKRNHHLPADGVVGSRVWKALGA